ncbi:PREDICTED: RING-H2 finger protein ATL3-like [Camelina sativa]|uniref:RING-H2 finger protein ATL3-like n=1 Tax=Camelina sativa TaxID=90675 RepID=A0ABM0V8V5_CAMSA|nr:PREDICTED: RING-H2 finger protein ATL3-like [Camelina sativa]
MGDSQSSSGYQYLFGEADEITKRLEEYHRERGRVDDYPVPVDNSPMINYHLQNQPIISTHYYNPISSEHYYSSQDISRSVYHRQFQNQPNTRHWLCWKCLIWWLVSMLRRLFVPGPSSRSIHTPMSFNAYPHSLPGLSSNSILLRIQERERVNIGGGGETVNVGEGLLTERQISQLPAIKFQPSIEDKQCMVCHLDFAVGEKITILPCTHKYHKDCIRKWLQSSKLCCVCRREVVV